MKKQNTHTVKGHVFALFTVLVWGTTFMATKVLLKSFAPVEILVSRFLLGYLALWAISPKRLSLPKRRYELFFAGAGLTGVAIYYMMENTALTYTYASNVSVICSVAPIFTGLFACLFLKNEKLTSRFFIGFLFAIAGIAIISLEGTKLHLNPFGDLLALLAAVSWGVYSVLSKKIGDMNLSIILCTRRIFFYGLVFMIPLVILIKPTVNWSAYLELTNLALLLFLGLGASATCYITWNTAIKELGAVKSSVYIYLVPLVTVVASAFLLHEKVTPLAIAGIVLILAGLIISENRK